MLLSLFQSRLAQCAIDHLGHHRPRGLLGQPVAQPPVDERHLQALDAVVGDVGDQIDVVDVKLAVGLGFGIDLAEEFDLVLVEVLAHLLHLPDVAEELRAQVAVADDGLLDHAQMGVDELDDLVLGTDLLVGHFVQLVRQS